MEELKDTELVVQGEDLDPNSTEYADMLLRRAVEEDLLHLRLSPKQLKRLREKGSA